MDATDIHLILASFAVVSVVFAAFFWRGRCLLNRWAKVNGLQILQSKTDTLGANPFTWTGSRYQIIYYVRVRNQSGKERFGWVRCGGSRTGVLSGKTEVRWRQTEGPRVLKVPQWEPTCLQHRIQGWPPAGPNSFRWGNGRLVYKTRKLTADFLPVVESVRPSPAQWREFWRVCDEIDVWSWPRTLGNMNVCDGLQWVLELEIADRRVSSRGQVSGSPPGTREKLLQLHRALQAMTGMDVPDVKF
jgi:hypothetical protein